MIYGAHEEPKRTLQQSRDGYISSAACPTCCFGARPEWGFTNTDMVCTRGHGVSIGLLRDSWSTVIQQAAQALDLAGYIETHFSDLVSDLEKERGLLEDVVRFYQ